MSARRKTKNRLTLHRTCGTCSRSFVTTADSPWIRQVPRDGKRQAITYYCTERCYAASYKHIGWFDGKSEERRKERDKKRSADKNRRYYEKHRDSILEKAKARYHSDPESSKADSSYQRKKRKLLA